MAIELINDPPAAAPAPTPAPAAAPVASPAAEPAAAPAATVVAPAPAPELAALLAEVQSLRDAVGAKAAPAATPAAAESVEEDLLVLLMTNPEEAIGRVLSKREKAAVTAKAEVAKKIADANKVVRENHPDLDAIDAAGEFVAWVNGNARYKAAYARSEREMDGDARSLLLDLFKGVKGAPAGTSVEPAEAARRAAAATGPVGGGGESVAAVKTMREADIKDLMAKDWDRYNAMLPEIRKAYEEGRVLKS